MAVGIWYSHKYKKTWSLCRLLGFGGESGYATPQHFCWSLAGHGKISHSLNILPVFVFPLKQWKLTAASDERLALVHCTFKWYCETCQVPLRWACHVVKVKHIARFGNMKESCSRSDRQGLLSFFSHLCNSGFTILSRI